LTTTLNFVDELIITIFEEVESQSTLDVTFLPKRYIQKILFKLTNENREDEVLFDSVPFYWYNHGPFSEIIAHRLDNLVNRHILDVDNKSKFYILKKNDIQLNQVEEYEDFIQYLIRNFSVFDSENLVMDVYYNDSPYDFIPTYKKEFLEPIEKKLKIIDNEDDFYEIISLDDLINICYNCEEKLPYESIYRGYNEQFSIFSTVLDKLYNEIDFNTFNITYNAIDEFWYTFAQALRVTQHHEFYNNKLERWKGYYYDKLKESRTTIKKLKELKRSNHSSKLKLSKASSEMLLSTVGKYISD
jgi:hypothetical protein